ncbi:MAG TPA: molybdopterin-dependent oxidoreductase [Rhizobiaceae bacterium]|nr:molybdopterin-dependent oxidoreductase [Rhizobiaceae bacterium]
MIERFPAYCTLCRSRCGCTVVVGNGRLHAVEPLSGHPTGGALCAKGRAAPELVASPNRLTRPLKRTNPRGAADPGWREIGWDEALDEIAGRLDKIRAEHGAEAVAFAVTTPSGTPMVDSFEWVERFVRLFGSPNLIYAVEVCGWHKDYAHALTFGRGIGMPDYEHADTILLWGHNPVRTWLAQASRIAEARDRGARVVVVDPKPEGSGQLADHWLRIRPGADCALAMGAIRHLIETRSYDADFVRRWTNAPMLVDSETGLLLRASQVWNDTAVPGAFVVVARDGLPRPYDTSAPLDHANGIELLREVPIRLRNGEQRTCRTVFSLLKEQAARYTPQRVAAETWLSSEDIEAFNRIFSDSPALAYHSWTGVGQHTNATETERAIAILYALAGCCDRPGGNLWPVPPPARLLNDYALLAPGQRAKALGLDALPLGPPAHGWITARDFSRAVVEGVPYKVRALVAFGTNFVVSQGNSSRNRRALEALEFQVHVDMFMNPTAETADIVLPASLPWERDALKIGFEITQEAVETIQFRPKFVEPPGECRADYEIANALALRLGMGDRFFGGDIEAGWNYQLAPLGISIDDLRLRPKGIRIPQSFRHHKYAEEDGPSICGFATPTRRVELYSEQMLLHGYAPLPGRNKTDKPFPPETAERFPFLLTTAKSGWFVHSAYRHIASLRRKSPDPKVEINPSLAADKKLKEGDWARIETISGSVRMRVHLNPAIEPRVVIAEFGWWEACTPLGLPGSPPTGRLSSNINDILSDDSRDPVSGSVPLRAVACDIQPELGVDVGRWNGNRRFILSARENLCDSVAALTLTPQDGKLLPAFRPGQYVIVSLPGVRRSSAYSLTGHGGSPDRSFHIAVRRHPSSDRDRSLSQAFHVLPVGAAVDLETPQGQFTPPLRSERPILLAAGGIGITPFMSYLETLALQSESPKVLLLHGCRNGGEHPFAREVRALRDRIPGLDVTVAYSKPRPEDRQGKDFDRAGRLTEMAPPIAPGERPLAYACGSPEFIAGVTEWLEELGVPRFDIFSEAFASRPEIPPDLMPRRITIKASGRTFDWQPESGTILDAALGAGIALPSGCRAGQCESCLVSVAAGSVAHLNDYSGEGCLTCQAVPLTEVTLAV